ncbi:oligosaccharide flippase family protein [Ruegeria sp.]|uniref:oligosaccharide flippase family protein n=1 Tax=Ruegeria sp. TaxID=1879320 RepID=UPI0023147DB9|nr:oligosaccharide flippase family protein [Ruegeria sp.]MDA7965966.1 oligosaccharide flippase family protein [Ruegeria sp.]
MYKSALLILSGNAFTSAMTFVRNLLVARLVSVEDYGIAATFAISMAIVELASNLGLQQLIVQDKDGNDSKLQAGLQGFQALRALFSAALLFFLAHPIAQFLGIPEVAWAYQVLALIPLLNGFIHFDIYRLQRQQVFKPLIFSTALPAFLSVLIVWPLFQHFGDYRVMLFAVLLQGIGTVTISHIVAQRPYKLRLETHRIRHALNFGWPLLINNVLLVLVFEGEKLVVGREMGMSDLAIFAMGFTLTLTPTLILAQSTQSFFLPQLSATKGDKNRFSHLAYATMQASLLNGLLPACIILVIGALFVTLVLGDRYVLLIPYLVPLAILQAVRVFKTGSATVALAQGRTTNAMLGNAFRALSLPLSWYAAIQGADLLVIIVIATIGELLGFVTSLVLVRNRLSLSLRPMAVPIAATFILLAAAPLLEMQLGSGSLLWLFAAACALLAGSLATMKDLRSYLARRAFARYSE